MYYFSKFVVGDLQELGLPTPYRYNQLQRTWDKLVHTKKRLCVLSARGHGKSLFFTEMYNIYDMFLFPYKRIIIESASQEQAERILDEIKQIVDNNEWLASKKNPDLWRAGKLGYNKGYILGKGFGSEILGEHVDRIVIDDILRSDNKLSDEEIEDFIDMTLEPMLLNRNGQMILVGTPRRETDIFAAIFKRVQDNKECPWHIQKFPAIVDFEKKILQCPDRFTWESIMEKRLSMGALKFAREYQLEFFSRDTSLFPMRIIQPAMDKGKDYTLMYRADKRDPNWTFVMGVDVARSGSVSADYSTAIVIAYNCITQQKQIAHIWRSKGMKITEQAAELAAISKGFNNCMMLVEQNNMGQDMIDTLIDDYNCYVESFITGGKGQKKDELIRFLITSFEYEQFVIPRGDEWSQEETNELISELTKFCVSVTPAGNEAFKGVGSHDDLVMGLALANRATQLIGVPYAMSSFDGDMNPNAAFTRESDRESTLVQMIRMGAIK